ncbi:MAG: rhomboid family intramembrane serine protease [Chloroflexi bacterium]|nr:MAG: rhomboid family intramembrane serine protease [Chloroflexota bacterium]
MSDTAPAGEVAPPQGPPPLALAVALDLVTRHHLRLTDDRDARLGPLAGAYQLGAAQWTGRRAAFVGFYTPPPDPAARPATPPPASGAVRVGAIAVDPATAETAVLLPPPSGLPGAGEIRNRARELLQGRPAPTLAAVDLAERQTVAGGYVAPVRSAMITTPTVTYALIAVFVGIWIIEKAVEGNLSQHIPTDTITHLQEYSQPLLALGAVANSGVFSHDWWRYVTSAFLHSDTSPYHVGSNALAMFFLGRLVEQLYGRLVLLGTFVLTAVLGGLFWVGLTAIGVSSSLPGVPAIGASGGIAGLAGLLLMLGRVQGRNVPAGLATSIRQYIILIAVLNLFIGLSIPGVNNYVHIGGFASGALLGVFIPPVAGIGGRPLQRWEQALLVAAIAFAAVALAVGIHNILDILSGPIVSPPVPGNLG